MKVELTAENEVLLRKVMEIGGFANESEAVASALMSYTEGAAWASRGLEAWPEQEIAELNESLRLAVVDVEAGNSIEATPELFKDIKRRGTERLKARGNQSA